MFICDLLCGCVKEVRNIYEGRAGGPSEYCDKHRDWFPVTDYTRTEWHSKCVNCPYGRSHGQAKVYAERGAAQHMARNPGHHVTVRYYNVRSKDRPPVEVQREQPSLFDNEPPF